ncbi:MAG: ROK family protein [Lentisphaerae bacterium]|nr:ROK family protein [Lentisphaerota bacterium]
MGKKIFIRHQQMKTDTLEGIINALKNGASCKREIQSQFGLSWGAVSGNIKLLLKNKIIVPFSHTPSSVSPLGRKSGRFQFSNTQFLAMGMELQEHRIITSLVNLGGKLLGKNEFLLPDKLTRPSLSANVKDAFKCQLKLCDTPEKSVIALSFSLTGAVDCMDMVWIKTPHIAGIQEYDFKKLKKEYRHIEFISVEHDVFARARATLSSRNWPDKNFVFLHLGNGVGMAVHNENGFLYGSRGLAGEIGHIPYLGNARKAPRKCFCGQDNCIETYLSVAGIMDFSKNALGLQFADISELFASATPMQMKHIYEYLQPYLYNICITAVNTFDPATLIVGGEIIEPWLEHLPADFLPELQKRTWLNSPSEVKYYRMENCNSSFGTALRAISSAGNAAVARLVQ